MNIAVRGCTFVDIGLRKVKRSTSTTSAVSCTSVARCYDNPAERFGSRQPSTPPPHQNAVHYRWKRTTAAADIEGVCLHDLRHFYASGLITAGYDVVTVQRTLRHARPTTTLNTYSHLWSDAEDRTRSAAAGLISAVYPDSVASSRTLRP